MPIRDSELGERDRPPTPEEATRNVDPREVRHVPKEWTQEDFIRSLRRATRRRGKGDDEGTSAELG